VDESRRTAKDTRLTQNASAILAAVARRHSNRRSRPGS
jgi:hypothetical protein